MAPVVTMRQLLEAGVHFGHQTRRWNPKMKRFIFGERNGIYIIDLQQTLGLHRAGLRLRARPRRRRRAGSCSSAPRSRRRTRSASYAEKCGMPYVNERWLGGMLTNFETIAKRVDKMKEYERMRASGEFDAMPKKEALILGRELEKLERNLGGIRNMAKRPDAVFVLDTKKEHIAVTEANKLGIPVVAVVDTNCRPRPRAVRHPGQRRRHPRQHADVPDHRRRRRGGPLHRQPAQPGGRRAGPDPHAPRTRPGSPPSRPTPAARPPPRRPSATPASPPSGPTRRRPPRPRSRPSRRPRPAAAEARGRRRGAGQPTRRPTRRRGRGAPAGRRRAEADRQPRPPSRAEAVEPRPPSRSAERRRRAAEPTAASREAAAERRAPPAETSPPPPPRPRSPETWLHRQGRPGAAPGHRRRDDGRQARPRGDRRRHGGRQAVAP